VCWFNLVAEEEGQKARKIRGIRGSRGRDGGTKKGDSLGDLIRPGDLAAEGVDDLDMDYHGEVPAGQRLA
jgi:hypothetical protein